MQQIIKIIYEVSKHFLHEHKKTFFTGFIAGIYTFGISIFGQPLLAVPFYIAYILKGLGVLTLAILSGLGTTLGGMLITIIKKKYEKAKSKKKVTAKKTNGKDKAA